MAARAYKRAFRLHGNYMLRTFFSPANRVLEKGLLTDDSATLSCQEKPRPGARYDPPFMFNDDDDLAVSKPTGFTMKGGADPESGGAAKVSWSNVDKAVMTVVAVDTGGACPSLHPPAQHAPNPPALASSTLVRASICAHGAHYPGSRRMQDLM